MQYFMKLAEQIATYESLRQVNEIHNVFNDELNNMHFSRKHSKSRLKDR